MITENVLNTFHGDVICASFCKRMTPNSDAINPLILFYHLEALHKSERIEQYQVQSTGIKNLKFSVLLENEFIATPPLDIQKYFESYVNPIIEEKEILSLQNVLLGKTRDLLLPKLISGELDVSDLKIAISEEA
ncbi:MAG: restriction endonuclease subunit S [Dethiobacteria bacterium]